MITTLAIQAMYPNAIYGKDFIVQDRGEGSFISQWNLPVSKPTEAELHQAWERVKDKPIPGPEMDQLKKRVEETENAILVLMDMNLL